jgi:hypothetical protein
MKTPALSASAWDRPRGWTADPTELGIAPVWPAWTLRDVMRSVASPLFAHPAVVAVKRGEQVPPDRYTRSIQVAGATIAGVVNPGALWDELSRGATLMFPNMERWDLDAAQAALQLARLTSSLVAISLFVTPPGERGLNVHRDRADVIVVQLEGSKLWSLYGTEPPAVWSSGPVGQLSETETKTEVRVDKGEVLWVPAGTAHAADALEALSIHLSCSLQPADGLLSDGTPRGMHEIAALDADRQRWFGRFTDLCR